MVPRAMRGTSTYVLVVISPATMQVPVVTSTSQATRPIGSSVRTASRTASEIWSAILSGCPSVTDSEVNMCLCVSAKVPSPKNVRDLMRSRGDSAHSLVPVMVCLVRPLDRHPQILRLLRSERGEFHPDLLQVQPRHLFVQPLGQCVHAHVIRILILPQIQLGQSLVGKA